jgi:hypothetical protein
VPHIAERGSATRPAPGQPDHRRSVSLKRASAGTAPRLSP